MNNRRYLLLGLVFLFGTGGLAWYISSNPPEEVSREIPEETDPWAEYAQSEMKAILSEQDALERFKGASRIFSRYRVLRNKVRGTKWEARASRQEASFRDSFEKAADVELERIRKKEKPLREKKVDTQILALYATFPSQFLRVTPAGEVAWDEIRTLRARIRDRFVRDRKILEEHLKAWELDSARAIHDGMEAYVSVELRMDFEVIGETIEEMELVRSVRIRREVADRYFRVDQAIRTAMQNRDCPVAIREITKFLRHKWSAEQRPFVFLRSVDYGEVIRLAGEARWEEVIRLTGIDSGDPSGLSTAQAVLLDFRAAALVSRFLLKAESGLESAILAGEKGAFDFQRARGSKSYLEKRGERTWLVVGEDRLIPISGLGSFPTVDVVQLGAHGWGADPGFEASGWGQMAAGLLFHYSGSAVDFARSRKYLESAKTLGMTGVEVYLSTLSSAHTERQEHMIRNEIIQIDTWIRKHRYEDAWIALDTLLRESDHPFVKENRGDLDRKLAEINAQRTVLQKMSSDFRAPVTYTPSGRLQVKYDFSLPKQLEAFGTLEKAGGHPLRGRWKWRNGVMESAAFPSAMQWKMEMKGDLEITYELTPLEEPQNIVVDLFYRPGGKKHYAVVFGFDWVGKANGDPENTVEERFGMPRNCVVKYPVDVLLQDWEIPGTWDVWKERLVGGAVQAVELSRDTTHYVRILRQGARIQLHVDGKLAWEGEDGEYREGFLLFYSDCRTRMDNIRIRFDAPK